MDGAGHALDDHAFHKAVILVTGVVRFIDGWIASLPSGQITGANVVVNAWGLATFTEGVKGRGTKIVEHGVRHLWCRRRMLIVTTMVTNHLILQSYIIPKTLTVQDIKFLGAENSFFYHYYCIKNVESIHSRSF